MNKTQEAKQSQYLSKKSLAFWGIIVALCAAGLLTALEATISLFALLTIIEAFSRANLYIWVVNIFFLTTYVVSALSVIPFS